jgi:hypothetical protein
MTNGSPMSGPIVPPAREGRRRRLSEADKRQILLEAMRPDARFSGGSSILIPIIYIDRRSGTGATVAREYSNTYPFALPHRRNSHRRDGTRLKLRWRHFLVPCAPVAQIPSRLRQHFPVADDLRFFVLSRIPMARNRRVTTLP